MTAGWVAWNSFERTAHPARDAHDLIRTKAQQMGRDVLDLSRMLR